MVGWPSFSSVKSNFSHFNALFELLEGPKDLGLDVYRYQGDLAVWFSYIPPKQPNLMCLLMILLMLVDP